MVPEIEPQINDSSGKVPRSSDSGALPVDVCHRLFVRTEARKLEKAVGSVSTATKSTSGVLTKRSRVGKAGPKIEPCGTSPVSPTFTFIEYNYNQQ